MGRTGIYVVALFVMSCTAEPNVDVASAAAQTGKSDVQSESQCLVELAVCQRDASNRCCEGLFCDDTGRHGACVPLRPAGDPCQRDEDCHSGHCENQRCAAECKSLGEPCFTDAQCCGRTFCAADGVIPDSVGVPSCAPLLIEGLACVRDAQCESGLCDPSLGCVQSRCSSAGQACRSDEDCCGNAFCNPFSTGITPRRCLFRVAEGEACYHDDRQCKGNHCSLETCESPHFD